MEIESVPKPALFQANLTPSQIKHLTGLLPKGYLLLSVNKKDRKEPSSKIIKKQFISDAPLLPIKVKSLPPQPQQLTSEKSNGETSNAKRALREKKKKKNHHENRMDYDSLISGGTGEKVKAMSEGTKKCLNLLQKLKKHECSRPFLYPVDEKTAPGYYTIIKEPMDISTVEKNLKNGVYSSTIEFAIDVRKIWSNAFQYNAKGSDIHTMTNEISNYFEKLYKDVENVTLQGNIHMLQKKLERLSKDIKELHTQKGIIRSQPPLKANKPGSIAQKPMTNTEKRELSQTIKSLPLEHLRGVWQIVSESTWQLEQEELEFDLEMLPVPTLRELERYAKVKMSIVQRKKGKTANSTGDGGQNAGTFAGLLGSELDKNTMEGDKLSEFPVKEEGQEGDAARTNLGEGENEDANSKGAESSFITDSDDVISEDEYKKEFQKDDDPFIFQAGEHGSMLSAFLIK